MLALDVPRVVLNTLSTSIYPLPVNLSWLHPAGAVLGILYLCVNRFRIPKNLFITILPLLGISIYIFFFETYKSIFVYTPSRLGHYEIFSMSFEIFFFLIVYFVCSLYIRTYNNVSQLKSFAERIIILIVSVHALLIFFYKVGIVVPLVADDGVMSRNGIAILAVLLFFLSFLNSANEKKKTFKHCFFFFIALFDCIINGSFGALVVLISLLLWCISARIFHARMLLRLSIVFLVVTLIASTAVYYQLVNAEIIPEVQSDTPEHEDTSKSDLLRQDAATLTVVKPLMSYTSRSATNYYLALHFLKRPLFGSGYEIVHETTVFGYISHSYLITIVTAYGLIASLLIFLFFRSYFKSFQFEESKKILAGMVILLTGTLIFYNDLLLWIALLLVLIKAYDSMNASAVFGEKKYGFN